MLDIGRQECSCKIGLWHGGRGFEIRTSNIVPSGMPAAAMDMAFSPVFGGELQVYVGFCNRAES
jgi:hypothetical protein